MARNKVVPSLSVDGFVSDPTKQIDKIFAYFMSGENLVSHQFAGVTDSLANIVKRAANDDLKLKQYCDDALTAILSRYFDSVTVIVTTSDIESDQFRMEFNVSVVKDEMSYSLDRAINILDSTTFKLAEVMNNGL